MTIMTIQPGDTLWTIGKRFGVSVEQIAAANGIDPHRYLVIGDSLIIPSPQEKNTAISVDGYAYPFIDRAALKKALPYLTYLSILSHGFDQEGHLRPLKGDEPLIQMAREAGVAPLMVLTTVDENGNFNSHLAARLLENPAAWDRLIEELSKALAEKGYHGITLDLQYIPASAAKAYPDFIRRLREGVAPRAVFVGLAPKTAAHQQGALYEGVDYKALGSAADRALLMTYEWGRTFGPPMAVAPIGKVEQVVDYALSALPAERISMGLANYGYDWRLPFEKGYPARSVSNGEAVAIARKYGATIHYDEEAGAPYFHYFDRFGKRHEVWYEDARSYQEKLSLLQRKGLKGAFIWNIMRFYQPLFTLLQEQFEIIKVAENQL